MRRKKKTQLDKYDNAVSVFNKGIQSMRLPCLFIYFFMLVILSYPQIAFAENKVDEIKFNSLEDIPNILQSRLRPNLYKEQYIEIVMQFLRHNTSTGLYLSRKEVENQESEGQIKLRQNQVSQLLRFDRDFDNIVNIEEEIRPSLIQQMGSTNHNEDFIKHLDQIIESQYKIYDKNKDGTLTYKEMSELSDIAVKNNHHDEYEQYLALDINKDDRLDASELKALAHAAFVAIDKNNDEKIQPEEYNPIQNLNLNSYNVPPTCNAVAVEEGLQLTSIGVYSGTALSTVTTAGQDASTAAIDIEVGSDNKPTYLFLTSHDPIIWTFKGNVDSIKNILITSQEGINEKAGSGIIGIPKEKITFIDRACVPHYYQTNKQEALKAKSAIHKLVGRVPDTLWGFSSTRLIRINSEKIEYTQSEIHHENPNKLKVPDGYDPRMWDSVLMYYPDGIKKIDASKVISANKAEDYIVMPSMAGISQLMAKGNIESYKMPLSATDTESENYYTAFRIVQDIPRYPSGLTGALSVTFIIAKGVKPPSGNPGHSCVILEETGKNIESVSHCP